MEVYCNIAYVECVVELELYHEIEYEMEMGITYMKTVEIERKLHIDNAG